MYLLSRNILVSRRNLAMKLSLVWRDSGSARQRTWHRILCLVRYIRARCLVCLLFSADPYAYLSQVASVSITVYNMEGKVSYLTPTPFLIQSDAHALNMKKLKHPIDFRQPLPKANFVLHHGELTHCGAAYPLTRRPLKCSQKSGTS